MKIYLGAGSDKKEGFENLDIVPLPGVVYVCDVTKGLPFKDGEVDEIYSQDFLEHIYPVDVIPLINEMYRVLKEGGIMEHIMPYAGSKNDFGSPSHVSHWNEWTWEHFIKGERRFEVDKMFNGVSIGDGFSDVGDSFGIETTNIQEGVPQAIHVKLRK